MEIDATFVEYFINLPKDSIEFSQKCDLIAEDLSTDKYSVLQLITDLGGLLVDLSPNNREQGVWVLTTIFERLSTNFFDTNQLEYITSFYTDRLKDHHQVIPPVILGFLALAKCKNFPKGAATNFLTALFNNISCQQQQEQDRYNIYRLFQILLEKYTSELQAMESNFVYGVLLAVDGERSPKNLIYLFKWFPRFLQTVKLGHLSEEAFEILGCYFPVDFKPSNELNTITRDQLANLLAPCLTAIPEFAQFCLPLAIEKLESSLEVAKIDALDLLNIGCRNFNQSDFTKYGTEITSLIQKELFNRPKKDLENTCLNTLTSVMCKIDDLALVKNICDTLKGNLMPDSIYFDCSIKILLSVTRASSGSCQIVVKEIVPILVNLYNITVTSQHRGSYLNILIEFYICYGSFFKCEDLKQIEIISIQATSEKNPDLREIGFNSLNRIVNFLSSERRNIVLGIFQKTLKMTEVSSVRKSILNCFQTIALNFSEDTNQQIITDYGITDPEILQNFLTALSTILSQHKSTENVIHIFVFYLTKNLEFSLIVFEILEKTLRTIEFDRNIQSVFCKINLTNIIIDWFLKNELHLVYKNLGSIAFVLKTIIGNDTLENQGLLTETLFTKFKPLNSLRIFIWDGILCRLKQNIPLNYDILNDLTLLLNENDDLVTNTTSQLLGNLINKCGNEQIILHYLDSIKHFDNVNLITFIIKALIMRNHSETNFWIKKLLMILENDASVAISFRTIIKEESDCLNILSYCNRNLLYQQHFFTVVTNLLSENYINGKDSFLLAFGYLMEGVPKQVVLIQFKKILKLIILTLDNCLEDTIVMIVLQIIKDLIIDKEQVIEDNLSDFVARFLHLSQFQDSMKVRILALQCLQLCTFNYPVFKLLLHKDRVLFVLQKILDDRKRIVRKEAVEARSLWFLIDSPM